MKNKKRLLLKIMLLIALGLSLPAISSSPTFTSYATISIESGNDNPSDNGGSKPVEAPKGGSTLDKIVDAAKSLLGGLLSGYCTPDSSKSA